MAKFCSYCGRPLQEGEVCSCRQERKGDGQAYQQPNHLETGHYQPYMAKKAGVPKYLVPIGQTVVGGILILFGLITGGWDWSYISCVAGAGFLLTGICGIIEKRKN